LEVRVLARVIAESPNVYQIAAPFEGDGLVNCYLIDAPRRALIDTGTASVPSRVLLPALKELGWDVADLRVIINTHMHIDHAGGNFEMHEASGAGIHLHRADAALTDREAHLEKYCRADLRLMGQEAEIPQREAFMLQLLGREWGIERALEDGDSIDLGGDVRLDTVHTPGHTPGSTSLFLERSGLLFSGDAVGGRGSRSPGFPLYYSAADYSSSLRRLLDMPIATLAQAHRYRWSRDSQEAVRSGADVRQTLEESLGVWQAIDDAVRAALAATPTIDYPSLLRGVVRTVAPSLGNDPDFDGVPPGSVATVAAHWRDQTG
jgi:glyoxylase-like metal-dependent hydrolase (beta-lactamase superfamily II)